MSLRTQLTLLSALSVAAAVIVVSLAAYFATQDRVRGQIDDSLQSRSVMVGDAPSLPHSGPGDGDHGGDGGGVVGAPDPFGSTDTFFQVIDGSGTVVRAPTNQQTTIPVGSDDIAVAAGQRGPFLHDTNANGVHLRVLTSGGQNGEAVQIGRSLAEVDASLSDLRLILFGVSGAGVLLAALVGLLVAHRALRPVARLTAAAEHVAATQEFDAPIDVQRKDEIGRLAGAFNAMLGALHESRLQQRQLVADASHELRTPLTSVRTNIDFLLRAQDLGAEEREELLRHVRSELEELTKVVQELVELASEQRPDAQSFEDVRLDQLAASVVERAARRSGYQIALESSPNVVVGNYGLLERAAGNLVDNAVKWSPAGTSIEVKADGGMVTVRDHGPGIADADRPRVFDRFYRAEAARGKPGSGLGLAIVKQIIEAHGGRVWVEPAAGWGTIAGFALDAVPPGVGPASAAAS